MIILVGGEKGGTGKSTIATNLATMRTTKGIDTLLFDIDPQKTSTFWASRRDENNISPRITSCQKILDSRILNAGVVIRNELKALMSKYENIIVDAGGAASEVLRAAMTMADILILPLMPSSFDIWTLGTVNNLISEVKHTNPNIIAKVVYNKVAPHPQTAKSEMEESNEILSDFESIKRFDTILIYRVAIRRSQSKGQAIVEYRPLDDKANEEINSLYREVFNESR
jgi:chromosome partitioning protein